MKIEIKTNGKIETYYVSRLTLLKNNRYVSFSLDKKDKNFGKKLDGEMFSNMKTIDILKSSFEIMNESKELY